MFIRRADGGAAKLSGLHIAFNLVEPTGQKRYQIIRHFTITGSAALGEEVIKAVIAVVLHGIQSVLQLFDAVCRRDEGTEHPPAACGKGDQQHGNNTEYPFKGVFVAFSHGPSLLPCSHSLFYLPPYRLVPFCFE